MKLPAVTGTNLLRLKVQLPDDLSGSLNLLFIPFYQWQQREVDSWIPLVSELEHTYPNFRYYELPTIQRLNIIAQSFINEGMRAGIPDPSARSRTITLYLDKQAFTNALDIPNEEHIYLLLIDRAGNVLWRTGGARTDEKSSSLMLAIQGLIHPAMMN
jgi:hypothetical protein